MVSKSVMNRSQIKSCLKLLQSAKSTPILIQNNQFRFQSNVPAELNTNQTSLSSNNMDLFNQIQNEIVNERNAPRKSIISTKAESNDPVLNINKVIDPQPVKEKEDLENYADALDRVGVKLGRTFPSGVTENELQTAAVQRRSKLHYHCIIPRNEALAFTRFPYDNVPHPDATIDEDFVRFKYPSVFEPSPLDDDVIERGWVGKLMNLGKDPKQKTIDLLIEREKETQLYFKAIAKGAEPLNLNPLKTTTQIYVANFLPIAMLLALLAMLPFCLEENTWAMNKFEGVPYFDYYCEKRRPPQDLVQFNESTQEWEFKK